MSLYKTEQRKLLIDYMTENSSLALSADGWIEAMKRDIKAEAVPGRSTVYRTIQRLTEEGIVIRTAGENSRMAKYQIAQCKACDHHLHLKCVQCGRLIHLSHEATRVIEKDLYLDSKFNIDGQRTVIYGKCSECK